LPPWAFGAACAGADYVIKTFALDKAAYAPLEAIYQRIKAPVPPHEYEVGLSSPTHSHTPTSPVTRAVHVVWAPWLGRGQQLGGPHKGSACARSAMAVECVEYRVHVGMSMSVDVTAPAGANVGVMVGAVSVPRLSPQVVRFVGHSGRIDTLSIQSDGALLLSGGHWCGARRILLCLLRVLETHEHGFTVCVCVCGACRELLQFPFPLLPVCSAVQSVFPSCVHDWCPLAASL
jgi:hypothetical protein